MKKKVLFALIALFSVLSSWAIDLNNVTVGGYTVSLDNKLVLIDATSQVATAPSFRTGVENPVTKEGVTITSPTVGGVYSYNAAAKDLTAVTTLNKIGNYFLQVTFTESTGQGQAQVSKSRTIYVPFTVGKEIKLWQVYDKASWDAALGDQTSMMASYYRDYPNFEIWDNVDKKLISFEATDEGKAFAKALLEQQPERYSHDFKAQLASMARFVADGPNAGAHPFPYLGFTLTEEGKYRVLVRRTNANDVPWSTSLYGNAEGAKKRSFVSLATEGSLLNNLGIEGGEAYSAEQPYGEFGVTIDNRATLEQQGIQVNNPDFGKAYKYENGQLTNEYASTLLEAVATPGVLAGMTLIAIPETDAAALGQAEILLTAGSQGNATVTITPKGEDDPIASDSKYTYPGVGMDDTADPVKGNFTVVVEYNGATLTEGVDYTIQWAEDQEKDPYEDAGTWPIIINGAGIYTTLGSGTSAPTNITVNYVVEPAPATPADAVLTASGVEYCGNETDDRAEEVATISYTEGEGATAKTVTETVEDYLDGSSYTKYVYVGTTKPTAASTAGPEAEVNYPNHVGFWEMRLYFAPEDGDANYKESYISDIFEVTPTQLAMHLGIINWPFGKDYPEINKLYYSIAKTEYAPGDGTNNVKIEGLGVVWPYEQIGSQQSEVPVGSPVGSYRWNLAPGQEALAVTTIGGVDYQNYYVVVHNDNAIINIGKSGLIISVSEDNSFKIYGDEDPDFRPIINNSNNDLVISYTKDKDGKVIATDANGDAIDLTSEAVIADEDLQAELTEMANIYAGVTITRKGGKGQTPRLEDVTADGYSFDATLSDALKASYNITKVNGKFYILPYDITPAQAQEATPTTPAVPEYTAGRFEITVPNVTYNGTHQTPAVSVIFHHDVLGAFPLYDVDDATATPKKVKSYEVGTYNNNKNVARDTDWKVKQNQATVQVSAAEGNANIYGTKTGFFTVNPAQLTVALKNDTKTYGEDDPEGLLACTISGFATVGEGETAKTEDPENATEDSEEEGKYYGAYVLPTVTRVKYGTPEGEVVGKYAITATGGKALNYNFNVATPGQLEIQKATLTVSATPFKLVPGDVEGEFERSEDLTFGDHILFDVVATGYVRNPFALEADANLLGEGVDGDDDIYDPADKTQEPAYGKITVSSQNAGAFTWAFTNEDGTPELENYTVEYKGNEGEIEPNKDGLWLTIEPKSKTYGTADPELTFVATLDGEEVDLDDLYLEGEEKTDIVLARTPGSNAGQYDITFSDGPETNQIGNYQINYDFESGKKAFTINKATLFVKATVIYPTVKDKDGKDVAATSIAYGEEIGLAYKNQLPGYAIEEYKSHISQETGKAGSGLIDGDDYQTVINEKIFNAEGQPGDAKSVNDFVEYSCDYEDEPGVGKFTVSAEGPEAKNYIIVYNDGVDALEVVAAELALKAKNQTINYNDLVEIDAETGKGKYNTPAIDDDIETWVTVIGGPLPAGVEIGDLVESISCDVTSVGTHEGAIVITPKESELVTVTNYQNGTLTVNPLDEIHLAYENVDQALEDNKGETLNVYLPARELYADKWYSMVLPFEVRAAELARTLYFGTIEVLDETDESKNYHFKEVTNGMIEANQPFIVNLAAEDMTEEIAQTAEDLSNVMFEAVTIADDVVYNDEEAWPFREDAYGNKFIGQYTGKTGLAPYEWAISTNPSSKNFGKWLHGGDKTTETYFEPTVAFLQNADETPAADIRIFIEENGVTTDITGVDADEDIAAEGAAEGWYTLTGVKLEGKPTVKGTYIYNGKTVYVK